MWVSKPHYDDLSLQEYKEWRRNLHFEKLIEDLMPLVKEDGK